MRRNLFVGGGDARMTRGGIALAVLVLWTFGSAAVPAKSEEAQSGLAQSRRGAGESATISTPHRESVGISANPAATNESTGTGWLGRQLGIERPGIHLGGLWIGAANYLMSGGVHPHQASFNNQVTIDLLVDLERTSGLKGSSFGSQFLQVNTDPSNTDAGSVMGYNSLVGNEPYNRSELFQIWWRQALFNERLVVRIGKSNPSADFQNVVRPITTTFPGRDISAVTNLLYTPAFTLPTNYGVLPGYDDNAFGITNTWAPNDTFYVSYGVYDGNQARGVATGLRGPEFNGYYFHIAETGMNWLLGPEDKPGSFAVGGWRQTGKLSTDDGLVEENGAEGAYFVGSQQLWYRDPQPIDNAGVSAFVQFGWNNAETLPFNTYVGAGLTFRALIPHRSQDSFGVGMAWGWLNPNIFENDSELMFQGYYQAHLSGQTYLQSTVSYIPRPGQEPGLDAAWAVTQQIIVPF